METIVNDIEIKNLEFNTLITNMELCLKLLKDFQADPDKTIKEIADGKISQVGILKEEFGDIKKGLEGDFTRATSINIGKKKLLSYLKGKLNEFKDQYRDIREIIIGPKKHLHDIYNVVDTNIDIETLQSRKERYHRSNLERDYMQKTIIKVLTTKLANSKIQACAKGFLQKILEVMAIIRTFEFNNIDKNIIIYNNRCYANRENYRNIGIDSVFNAEETQLFNKPDVLTGEQHFTNILMSLKLEEDLANDVVDLLDLAIDDLSSTCNQLKINIEKLISVCDKFTTNEFNTKYYANGIIEAVVDKYDNLELTDDKFFSMLKDSIVVLKNINGIEIDILNLFGNVMSKLDNYLYMFNYIYGACEECSIKGTIISSGVAESNASKK